MNGKSSPAKSTAHPGTVLKSIRTERGWTLAQVSKRTGIPITTLSKIENDRVSLSYDKLVRISNGLGIDISRLFGAKEASGDTGADVVAMGRRSITRDGEGSTIETRAYVHVYPAAELLNKRLVPVIVELKARTRAEFGDLIRHAGEEYALVLEGAVEFHTDLYAPVLLGTGDSIYFDSSMAHGYIAALDTPCRIVSMCSAGDLSAIFRPEEPEQASEQRRPTVVRSA
jgi:transcriptional regulator with XRE-family HTH domain